MATRPSDQFVRHCKLIRVVDGDTIRGRIDLGWTIELEEIIRLAGVDTPENRGPELPAGRYCTDQVRGWFATVGHDVVLQSWRFRLDKYQRCIADVWSTGGSCLNEWLLDAGLAWPTDQQGNLRCERDIRRLAGIPEPIREEVRLSA